MALLPGVVMVSDAAGTIARNTSSVAQTPAAATRTQIAGTLLTVPQGGLKVGSIIKFKFNMTKTAAGTATSTFDVSFGTAGTVADTARVSFTKPAGTAVVDDGDVEIILIVRSVSATGVLVGQFVLQHGLDITGHAIINPVVVRVVAAGFDNRGEGNFIALNITSGAADAITIDMVEATLQRQS